MSEVAEQPAAEAPAVPAKKAKKAAGPKKPKTKPTHPPVAQMIGAAIKTLKERNGSSLAAIKKYMATNYKVDVGKLSPFIKKSLKTSVVNGKLIQTKGKGASGSFKLPSKEAAVKKPKKAIAKKPTAEKKAKKAKKSVEKKAKAATAKTAKKQKSTKPKAAAKKPKAPKPKKAKKPAAKKAAKK